MVISRTLLESCFESFKELAQKCVKDSLNQVYDLPATYDSHYIVFSRYDNELHEPIKQDIYRPKVRMHILCTVSCNIYVLKHE